MTMPRTEETRSRLAAACWAPTQAMWLQLPRALVVSTLALGLDVAVLVALKELGGLHPLAAATISYLLGGVVQYLLCSWWVFPTQPDRVSTSLVVFLLLSLVGLGITDGVMKLLGGHTHYLVAKGAAVVLSFAWNFTSRKYLIFRAQRSEA